MIRVSLVAAALAMARMATDTLGSCSHAIISNDTNGHTNNKIHDFCKAKESRFSCDDCPTLNLKKLGEHR
ncbi:hypothetical protein AB1N83_005433 [Pleurotus pulmonarius]